MTLSFCDYHILAFLTERSSHLRSTKPLDLALSTYFKSHKSLGSKDRKKMAETLYGMARWQSLLDYKAKNGSPQERIDIYKNLSAHLQDPQLPPWIRLGSSEFLYVKCIQAFGKEKGEEILEILNTEAPTTIRVNSLKTTREALVSLLSPLFDLNISLLSPWAIHFSKRVPLFALPSFKEGLFEVQDEGSQLLAALVQPTPKQIVLDYCSGSGGKTLAFAPLMQGQGQIYLHDIRESALAEAKQRLRRAGIQNAQCLPSGHKQWSCLKAKCDWVLTDVPCSGTGALRRNPEQKWKLDAPTLQRFKQLQQTIVKEALAFLKPGGKLVYATCSLFPEENEEQIDYFVSCLPLRRTDNSLSLLPSKGGMDGFFGTVLVKT